MAHVSPIKVTKNWRTRYIYFGTGASLVAGSGQIYQKLAQFNIPFSIELEPIALYVQIWVPGKHSANLDTIVNELFNR